jgi:hypothetical protein
MDELVLFGEVFPEGQQVVAEKRTPTIADHALFCPIAAGSYGEVWLARSALGTMRAVKIVRADRFERSDEFEREFHGLERFEPVSRAHPGLVDILQIGRNESEGWFYYVMELADCANACPESTAARADSYVPRTLRHELRRRGPIPVGEVIGLGMKLAHALSYLHEQGLVHRDVKPSNILFFKGEPKLADAGLVTAVDDARSIVGTIGYLAPEGIGTPQADIYALGKVLYEAAFGKDRQEYPQLPADLAIWPDQRSLLELNEVVVKACAFDARTRYARATAMRIELELLASGRSVKRKRSWERLGARTRRAAVGVTAGMAILASLHYGHAPAAVEYLRAADPRVDELVRDGFERMHQGNGDRVRSGLALFEEALQLQTNYLPALYGVADADIRLRHDPARFADLRQKSILLNRLYPGWSESLHMEAYVKWWDGQFQDALALARKTTESRAACEYSRAYSYLEYGFFLQCTGEPGAARAQYLIAERFNSHDPTIQDHLGQTYLMERNYAEAIRYFVNSTNQEPRHHFGHQLLGLTYEELQQFDRAIDEFETNAQMAGDLNAEHKLRYAQLREAIKEDPLHGYWRKRLDLAANDPTASKYSLALFNARVGNWAKAYDYLRKSWEAHEAEASEMMCDLAWNRDDQAFREVAQKVGLIR